MSISKYPYTFAKEGSIWVADNFEIPKRKEKFDDGMRFLLDISKARIFSTYEFSEMLRYWTVLGWIKEHCYTYSIKTCRLMDMGCSWSQLYHMWHRSGNYINRPRMLYYGLDAHLGRLKKGRDIYPKKSSDKWFHLLCDLTKPIRFKKKFDIIICMELIEHVKRKRVGVVLRNIMRNLADNGLVIISSPNPAKSEGEKFVWGDESKEAHEYEYSFKQAMKLVKKYGFIVNSFYGLCPKKHYRPQNSSIDHIRWLSLAMDHNGLPRSMARSLLCFLDNSAIRNCSKHWVFKMYKSKQETL